MCRTSIELTIFRVELNWQLKSWYVSNKITIRDKRITRTCSHYCILFNCEVYNEIQMFFIIYISKQLS
jgi:hypothetical protein